MLKLLLPASVSAIALALAGCGGGSNSSGPGPTAEPAFTLTGSAAKGLIRNARIEIYGGEPVGSPLATAQIGPDGTYTLEVEEGVFTADFVYVQLVGDEDSTMVCDAPSGCNGVAFGETFPLPATFTLAACIPTPEFGSSRETNLSLLTDFVAELSRRRIREANLSVEGLNADNAQIAAALGINIGDLSRLPFLDVTQASEAEDDDAVRAALFAAGALEAAFGAATPDGFAGRLRDLREDVGNRFGQFLARDAEGGDDTISFLEILEGAEAVADATPVTGSALDSVRAELAGARADAEAADAGSSTDFQVSPTFNATPLEQAKAFVADIQTVFDAANLETNETLLEDFVGNAELAGTIIADEVEFIIIELLPELAEFLLVNALQASVDDPALNLFTGSTEFGPVTANISRAGDDVTLGITQTVQGVQTEMTFVVREFPTEFIEVEEGSLETVLTRTVAAAGDVSFDTRFSTPSAEVSIEDGDVSVESAGVRTTLNNEDSLLGLEQISETLQEVREVLASDLVFKGKLKLSNLTPENPFNFEGVIGITADSLRAARTSELGFLYEYDFPSFFPPVIDFGLEELNFAETGLVLSGVLSDLASGANLGVTLDAQWFGDGSAVLTPEMVDIGSYEVVGNTLITDAVAPFRLAGAGSSVELSLIAPEDVEADVSSLSLSLFDGDEEIVIDDTTPTYQIYTNVELNEFGLPPVGPIAITEFAIVDLLGRGPVLKSSIVYSEPAQFTEITLYSQASSSVWGYQEDDSPPTDIVGYLNSTSLFRSPQLICSGGGYAELLLRPPFEFSQAGGQVSAFVTNELFFCNGSGSANFLPSYIPVGAAGGQSSNDVGDISDITLNAGANARLRTFVGVEQNLIGLDADDPSVSIDAFGTFTYDNGSDNFSGLPVVRLAFGGRRFLISASNANVLDDFDLAPSDNFLVITNQDDIEFTLDEENGTLTGQITKDGEVLGTVEQALGGVPTVMFSDGSFVSLPIEDLL